MPSLQDGGFIRGIASPGFTRGYFHSLPLGAGAWAGLGLCFPRPQKRDLHPPDQDLSVGTPDLGHPFPWWIQSLVHESSCFPTHAT
jgi:hypothetical protein